MQHDEQQAAVGLNPTWCQRNRLPKLLNRFAQPPLEIQIPPEIHVYIGSVRQNVHRFAKNMLDFAQSAELVQTGAKIVVRRKKRRLQFERRGGIRRWLLPVLPKP